MRRLVNRRSRLWIAGLTAVLLVGFALRVAQLDDHPLWWDEGNNIYFAHQGLLGVFRESRATLDTDPPVHRLALGVWKELVGSSPFSMRFFSAMAGVLAIALTWTVGNGLGDRRGALLGALLVALAPIHVYYGREAKGYAFVTAVALLSTYAWGCKLGYADAKTGPDQSSRRWWAVYVLSTAAGLATHYYFALLILWQGVWTVGSLGTAVLWGEQDWHRTLAKSSRWLLAVVAVLLLISPWVIPMSGSTARGAEGLSANEPLSLPTYIGEVGLALCAGLGQEGLRASLVGFGLLVTAAVGLLAVSRCAFWATWVAVPLGAAFLIQTVYSFFYPRFLLYLGPAFYLLVAHGTVKAARHLPRIIPIILIVGVIVLWLPGLGYAYAPPVDQAEDPRPAIARLRAAAKPGDALVYVYIWQVGYVLSYYPEHDLSFYRAYWTPQTAGPGLESVFDSHPRLWRLSYKVDVRDPCNPANVWLESNAYRIEANWFGNHNLALYVGPDFHTRGVGPVTADASFDGKITLHYPRVDARMAPGDVLALPLLWQAVTEIDQDYIVFLHLGLPGEVPIAQSDGHPYTGPDRTKTWVVDEEVMDRRALVVPYGVSPGQYRVGAGLYRPSDGRRLPVDGTGGQDILFLGQVEVTR